MCDRVYVIMQSCRLWLFACNIVNCPTRLAARKCLIFVEVSGTVKSPVVSLLHGWKLSKMTTRSSFLIIGLKVTASAKTATAMAV